MMTTPAAAAPAPLAADPAWDEAFLRVESYLRAHGLASRVRLNEATVDILREARDRAAAGEGGEPVRLAMQAAHARIGAWLARNGRPLDWTDERMRARGRLALVIADLPGRWPNYFLSGDPAPAEFAAAVTAFEIFPGPELRLSNMAAAPLEFGFEADNPRLPGRRLALPARALVSWLLIVGFFSIAWAASH